MRTDIPAGMGDIWRSGDYTGAQRPIARVTLQQARIEITEYDYANAQAAVDSTLPLPNEVAVAVVPVAATTSPFLSLAIPGSVTQGISTPDTGAAAVVTPSTVHQQYASVIFGSTAIPKELPNVKSVSWSRADSQDFATATLVFYNTKPLPIGETPTRDLDLPGYYTFNRGQTSFANRWGQTPNEWANLLLPDNLLRTYEGYGCNPYQCPELDEHLVQTGMWLIDKVAYGADGLITVTVRDVGRVLGDQIIFPPVIPKDFYPLSFGATNEQTGLVPPKVFTYSVDSGGNHDPNHPPPDGYLGPFTPPSNVRLISVGDRTATVGWSHPGAVDSHGRETHGGNGTWANGGPNNDTQIKANITADTDNIAAANYAFTVAAAMPHSNTDETFARNAALAAAHAQRLAADTALAADQDALFTAEHIDRIDPIKGYLISGYQLVLDGVRLPDVIPAGAFNDYVTPMSYVIPSNLLRNGIVYTVHMVAIWREDLSDQGEISFGTNVELSEVSDRSAASIVVRPRAAGGPDVVPFVGGTNTVSLGAWSSTHAYSVNNVVSFGGLNWRAVAISVGAQPDAGPTPLSRVGWVASASPAGTPGNAIDANPATSWTTTAAQAGGEYLQVDMLTPRTFNVIQLAGASLNYPVGLTIEISSDGVTWSAITGASPSGYPVLVSFATQEARYLRIVQTSTGTQPWVVSELNVYTTAGMDDWVQTGSARGGYDPTVTNYVVDDIVDWQGSDYVALHAGTLTTPPSADWQEIGAIQLNVDTTGSLKPGAITFGYDDRGVVCTWKLLAYRDIDATGLPTQRNTYSIVTTPGSNRATFLTGTDLGDMTQWNYNLYGMLDDAGGTPVWHPVVERPVFTAKHYTSTWFGIYPQEAPDLEQVIGQGDVFYRTNGKPAEFFAAPISGAAAHDPGPAPTAPSVQQRLTVTAVTATTSKTVTTPVAGTGGTTTRKTPIVKNRTGLSFDDSSNTYYVGQNGSVFGHTPDMAFDTSESSYWLSISNARNDAGYSFEWIQGSLGNVDLDQIEFTTAMTNYGVYISVFAKGSWVRHDAADVIPYDPQAPESHNGGNIPYCETYNCGNSEGPHTITFRDPIPGATKVRITLHNLQDFNVGTYPYRAGVRDFKAYAQTGGDTETINTPQKTTTSTISTTTTTYDESISATVTPAPIVAGPPQDDDDPEIVRTYESITPAHIVPGAGTSPGLYSDYTDIVKLFCAWGGFFWPEHATQTLSNGTQVQFDFGTADYGLENVDPVLGAEGSGRVWGDFEQTGTAGPALIPVENWDKKTLMDGISFVREIIGFLFYIDEQGGVVWRQPNVFQVGNWIGNYGHDSGRTSSMVTIDERQTLIGLTATVDSSNVRERVFVATVDGTIGALAKGWNPNPIGLRRVAGWTDQHFGSNAECQVMADLIALRQLFTYRTDQITIPGYPCLQVDDQVRIFEQVTSEGFIHYISSIQSSLDMETGAWTYTLDTHWLGEDPLNLWVFQPTDLAIETQAYLAALQIPAGAPLPEGTV